MILGLLVGGVLAGQSLIRAAELRSITTQYSKYVAATQSFRDKYFALPGDMTNATAFWGTAIGCPNDGSMTGVCNGDGNGQIGFNGGGLGNQCENQEFWRHLAKAGLIEGIYTTSSTQVDCYSNDYIGTQMPSTKLSGVGIMISYTGTIVTGATFPNNFLYPGNYGNVFYVGSMIGVNWTTSNPAFKTEEAWNIDTKIDDGKPDSGIMTSVLLGTYNTGCATSVTQGSAAYALSNTSTNQCSLVIQAGF